MRPVHGTQWASDRAWWSVVSWQPTILLIGVLIGSHSGLGHAPRGRLVPTELSRWHS